MNDVLAAVKRYGDARSAYAVGGVAHERVTEAFAEVRDALAASVTDELTDRERDALDHLEDWCSCSAQGLPVGVHRLAASATDEGPCADVHIHDYGAARIPCSRPECGYVFPLTGGPCRAGPDHEVHRDDHDYEPKERRSGRDRRVTYATDEPCSIEPAFSQYEYAVDYCETHDRPASDCALTDDYSLPGSFPA